MQRFVKSGLVVLLLLLTAPAWCQPSLAQARADGLVGERVDGLIGIVIANPSPELKAMTEQVNQRRLEEYRRIAEETDAPLAAVQQRAGRRLIQQLKKGEYFTDASGRWRQK